MKFGQLVKDLRIEKRLTLRQFCLELGLDPSNWSKIERGINPPPRDQEAIEQWADFFELEGVDRQEFLDAAALARNELPKDMIENDELVAKLPAFFRAVRENEQDEKQLKQLLKEIKAIHSPD